LIGLGAALAVPSCTRIVSRDLGKASGTNLDLVRRIKFDVPNSASWLAWSHDGERVVLGGLLDKRLSVWDARTGARLPAPGDQIGGTEAVAYSPDGRYLAVARTPAVAEDRGPQRYTVSLWDARTAVHVQNLIESDPAEISRIEARSLAFSANGRYLAVAYGRQVAVYVLDSGSGAKRAFVIEMAALACTFRPDNATLACLRAGQSSPTVLLQVPEGRVLDSFVGPVTAEAWSSDGNLLALARDGAVALLNVATRSVERKLSAGEPVAYRKLSFSANGRWLAGVMPRRIDLWDTQTWTPAGTIVAGGEHERFQDGAFSLTLSRLGVTGGNQLAIWEARDR